MPMGMALVGSLVAAAATAIGALPALIVRTITDRWQDIMLGFAAGVMIWVVSHEIVPETHRKGHEQAATLGFIGGFVVMMLLDTALG